VHIPRVLQIRSQNAPVHGLGLLARSLSVSGDVTVKPLL